MTLLFAIFGALAPAHAAEPATDIPKILGCPAYTVIKDRASDTGEIRWLTRVTRQNCVYADVTGKTDLQSMAKPKK